MPELKAVQPDDSGKTLNRCYTESATTKILLYPHTMAFSASIDRAYSTEDQASARRAACTRYTQGFTSDGPGPVKKIATHESAHDGHHTGDLLEGLPAFPCEPA